MKISYKRTLAALLATTTLSLALAACKTNTPGNITSEASETDTGTEKPTPAPLPAGLAHRDTAGKPIVSATFCKSFDQSEAAPEYSLTKGTASAPDAALRAEWNGTGLRLIFRHAEADSLHITLNTYMTALTPENGETSITIRAEDAGVRITDLGQLIPLSVSIAAQGAAAEFDGFIRLVNTPVIWSDPCTGLDAFQTELNVVGSPGTSLRGMDVGITAKSDGILLYDRYSLAKNAARMRIEASSEKIPALGDSVRALRFSCDVNVRKMPVFPSEFRSSTDAEGLVFSLTTAKGGSSALFGLVNTESGLRFFINNGSELLFADTGVHCGETFRQDVLIQPNGTVTLFVNGYEIAAFESAAPARTGAAENTLRFFWQRNGAAAESDADSFEAKIGNLTVSAENTTYLADTVNEKDLFGGKDVINALDSVLLAPDRIDLPDTVSSRKYGLTIPAIWKSSDASVIAENGTVTPPQKAGKVVDLTLYLSDGSFTVSERRFRFFVKATDPDNRVLRITNDRDPYTGSGEAADVCVSFASGSSLIYDMGSVTEINRVTLDSLPDSPVAPIKDFLSLYISNDNRTWQRVSDFSLLSRGTGFTVYNIRQTARYIKIHSSEALSPYSTAIGSLQTMMTAFSDDGNWLSDGNWAKSTVITVRNDGAESMRSRVLSYTAEALGISLSDLRADCADIRFTVGKTLLPHCFTAGSFYVRVPEIPAGGAVEIKILYSNPLASSVSDGNETFEVRSGTRYVSDKPTGFWRTSVAQMPDGSLLMMGVGDAAGTVLATERSNDGGFTWSATQTVSCSKVPGTHVTDGGGGFIVDRERNLVFYFSFTIPGKNSNSQKYEVRIYQSSDSGNSWTGPIRIAGQPDYVINYADGIVLSAADGAGSNVDYVFPVILNGGSSSLYSQDGGKTWQLSGSLIKPDPALGSDDFFEGGNSEATILEQDDGTIVMYMRCQMYNNAHFGVAHSSDHGITWESFSRLSNVYAPNTQPILDRLSDGTPILLWGGNHSMGATSHLRFPLSLATSDDGGETFWRILDASEQTYYANRDPKDRYDITNPDIVIFRNHGVETAYIITKHYTLLIEDFDRYLKETQGVFDSFENRTAEQEGWLVTKGRANTGSLGATDGQSALRILPGSAVTRSIPGVSRGSVTMDLFFDIGAADLKIAFQPAYNATPEMNALTFFTVDADGCIHAKGVDGKAADTGLRLTAGNNTVTYRFDGTSRTATLTVNGKSAEVLFNTDAGDMLCSVILTTGSGSGVCLDRFIVIPEL